MADIFISYAREDRDAARRLASALEASSWDVWWDRELLGGDGFRDEIDARLRSARCVIVLWSQVSIESRWVRAEASRALDDGKLVPLALRDSLPLPLPFGEVHTLPFWEWDDSVAHPQFRQLAEALSARSGAAPATTGPGATVAGGPGVAGAGKPRAPIRRALLVGVDGYADPTDFPPLATPQGNVRRLEAVLQSEEGGGFEVTALLDPTHEQMQTVVLTFFRSADLAPDDVLLFYFAGHARVGEENDLYLCAQNAGSGILDATALSLVWLANRALNKSPAENLLIVLDCLYRPAPDRVQDCDVGAVLHANLGQGKAKYLLASSTVVDAPVLQGRAPSLLAERIVHGISSWEAAYGDEVLSAEELCRYACEQVSAACPAAEPRYWGFNTGAGGKAVIARRAVEARAQAPVQESDRAFFAALRNKLELGRVVPFIGDGVYGTGALSSFRLIGEMGHAAGLEAGLKVERYPLATAAEYLQEVLRGRDEFLASFKEILEAQMREARPTAIHDFVSAMRRPWVAVCATYDWQLEARLDATGEPFTVVAHVAGSPEHADDGKMLIATRGPEPATRICAADAWTLSELGAASERIVYKIVGSPWLNGLLDPDLGIDTVVVTESDHLRFLSRLENGQAGFPPALARPLQSRSMLFLGYNLDVWHYRLVGHIFGNGGPAQSKNRFAVRTATSPLEDRFWARLVASEDRLRSDAETFVRTLRGMEAAP